MFSRLLEKNFARKNEYNNKYTEYGEDKLTTQDLFKVGPTYEIG